MKISDEKPKTKEFDEFNEFAVSNPGKVSDSKNQHCVVTKTEELTLFQTRGKQTHDTHDTHEDDEGIEI